ncbi:MAG: hypothetical protein IPM15_19950 [Betaproteobacteria bacterium]|nr:hypothetical protein [Betaproteobacteria bacterium]MCC6247510.1 hypothetical protein [Rubrivivax sp.]MCL4696555.1 hypothetical protein [Burkholderiaceae bacterium]
MSQITLHAPAPVVAPRGAEWGASAFYALLKLMNGVWKAGRAKTAAARRGREAAALRQLAARVAETDPGFASDLFAAADRHMG